MEHIKKYAITISGTLGSGKSTAANLLGERLGFARYSGGDFMRTMAKDRGMTMQELSDLAIINPEVDKEIDGKLAEFMRKQTNYVVDARLGWFWEPAAFKVFLTLPDEAAATRILKDLESNELRKSGEAARSYDDILAKIRHRLATERKRYHEYYGIEDQFDPQHFDIIIDTSVMPPDQVVATIIDGYEKWLSE